MNQPDCDAARIDPRPPIPPTARHEHARSRSARLIPTATLGIRAPDHPRDAGRGTSRAAALDLAGRSPAEGARILDVGAGSGEIAASVLDRRPDLTIEGIDVLIRPQTLIPVRKFDGRAIDEPDASWDYGMLIDVLHHCDRPEELLAEVLRVARKGVVIKDHVSDSGLDRITLCFMDWIGNRGHNVVLPYNYLSSRRWREIFGRLGLESTVDLRRLAIYPFPASSLFDRNLHFLDVLETAPKRDR